MFVGHYGVALAAVGKHSTVGLVHRCAMAGCDLVDPCGARVHGIAALSLALSTVTQDLIKAEQ